MEGLSNDLNNVIKNYVIFKPKTKDELKIAVDLWCIDKEKAITKYGYISNWNTSLINDMSNLFEKKETLMIILIIGMYHL